MKVKTFFASLILLATTVTGFAQNSSFDKELSAWHKKAVMTCGMIKSPEVSTKSEAISKNLTELNNEFEALTQKYKANPPAEYKNDPIWTSYFDDLADNLTIIKNFADKKEYRIASKNCSVFCQTILRMHKNNGTVDITDMLFSLNMQMKLATDISNAGNTKGSKESLDMIKKIMEHLSMKIKSASADVQALYIPVEKNAQDWIKAIEAGDAKTVKSLYASFMPDFQKIFMASM